jgi:hypothetical protein
MCCRSIVTLASLVLILCLQTLTVADSVQQPRSSKPVITTTLKPAEIDTYISQLGDKQYQKRNQAKDVLEQLGPLALPNLKNALKTATDPEIKRQLQSIIPALEQSQALEPTRLTLTCKDKPLKEVVKEIEKQTKYKIEVVNVGGGNGQKDDAPVSLSWNKVSFWEAMQSLADQHGLLFQDGWYGPDNMTIRLTPGEMTNRFTDLQGPFRITATGFYYNRSLNFSNRVQGAMNNAQQTMETLQVNMSISVEPRMPLLSVRQPIITEATDENGQSLMLPINPQRNGYYQHGYRSYMHQVNGSLKPSANSRKLTALKGTIPVTLVAETKPKITIPKVKEAKGKTFKEGAATINIEDVTTDRGQPGIKMTISENIPNGQQDYTWMNSIQQRIEVYDENGNKLQNYGGSWNMNGNNTIAGTFHFSGVPVKMVYYDWITLSYQVPFSFTDLPLP